MSKIIQLGDDHFHDHCGVFGIFGHPEAAKMSYLGLYALQHRGQESAGIASTDGAQVFVHKSLGLVQEIFTPDVIARLPGDACHRAHAVFDGGRQHADERAAGGD